MGAPDTRVAAHALRVQALLATGNTREFSRVTGLQLDDWALEAQQAWQARRTRCRPTVFMLFNK